MVLGLEFGVWGLGFEDWGLEIGVWGLGLRVFYLIIRNDNGVFHVSLAGGRGGMVEEARLRECVYCYMRARAAAAAAVYNSCDMYVRRLTRALLTADARVPN